MATFDGKVTKAMRLSCNRKEYILNVGGLFADEIPQQRA